MKNINIYDVDFTKLQRKADELDTTVAEIISVLVDEFIDEV